ESSQRSDQNSKNTKTDHNKDNELNVLPPSLARLGDPSSRLPKRREEEEELAQEPDDAGLTDGYDPLTVHDGQISAGGGEDLLTPVAPVAKPGAQGPSLKKRGLVIESKA